MNYTATAALGLPKSSIMQRMLSRGVSTATNKLWQQPEDDEDDDDDTANQDWHKESEIVTIQTPWMTLLGEHWIDNTGKRLDYWRVQRADSAVIVTLQQQPQNNGGSCVRFLIPRRTFRPGIGIPTLNFPGGRIPVSTTNEPTDRLAIQHAAVQSILRRELGITETNFWDSIQVLNQPEDDGWPINSSFSNQRLFGFVVHIRPDVCVDPKYIHPKVYTTESVADLLSELNCLQCRTVLLEWMWQR
jgi:hypothetical protein